MESLNCSLIRKRIQLISTSKMPAVNVEIITHKKITYDFFGFIAIRYQTWQDKIIYKDSKSKKLQLGGDQ